MYCIKCGIELPGNETMCEKCKMEELNVSEEAAVIASVPEVNVEAKQGKAAQFIAKLLNLLALFFKTSPTYAVKLGAEDSTPYWGVFLPVNAIVTSLIVLISYNQLSGGYFGGGGYVFLWTVIISVLVQAAMALGAFVILKVYKLQTPAFGIANIATIAAFPLTLTYILGCILGQLLPALAVSLIFAGIIVHFVLLYIGIQKIDRFTKSPLWAYALMIMVVVLIFVLCGQAVIKSAIEDTVSSFAGAWF